MPHSSTPLRPVGLPTDGHSPQNRIEVLMIDQASQSLLLFSPHGVPLSEAFPVVYSISECFHPSQQAARTALKTVTSLEVDVSRFQKLDLQTYRWQEHRVTCQLVSHIFLLVLVPGELGLIKSGLLRDNGPAPLMLHEVPLTRVRLIDVHPSILAMTLGEPAAA